MGFRNEVFQICKKLKKMPETDEIKNLIKILNIHIEKTDSELIEEKDCRNRSDFGYVSRRSNNQFYGYLYTDENIESYKAVFPSINHLEKKERELISQGHSTIIEFVNGCLDDINKEFPVLHSVINPYSKYKSIGAISEKSLLDKKEYRKAIDEFKNTKLYKKLFSSQLVEIYKKTSLEKMETLLGVLERDIIKKPFDIVPEDIRDFSLRMMKPINDISDLMMAEAIIILALRESLAVACQLLFVAMSGEELIILNNDNIIKIENNKSDHIFKLMTVLVDGIILRYSTDLPGDILLMDCDPIENYHIHDFGFIMSATISFNNETGQTTKLNFITFDDDINILHILTNTILKTEFPPVIKPEK